MPTSPAHIPRFFLEILNREFVIDMKPVQTAEAAVREETKPGLKGNRLPIAPRSLDGKGEKDLFTQFSEVLIAKERLEKMATELKSRTEKGGTETLMRLFRTSLPMLDSFDRVLTLAEKQPPSAEMQNWLRSVAGVRARMTDLFSRFGLQILNPVGEKVDLDHHEVVEVLHTESIPDDTIVEVRQKGYLFEGKMLRDARVVVAQNTRR